jgi:F-type H+-transporting ATPase subunit b
MLAALLPLAVESTTTTEDSGSSLIEPIPGLMIWTLISFAITFFVLRKYAFGPIQQVIDQRRERIRESLAEADRARDEARSLLEEHRSLMKQARGQAEEILVEARRVADSQRERVKQEVEEDRQRRLEETRRQIEAETQRALGEIRREVADLALVAAEKVTAGALDPKAHRRLIDDAIKEIDFSRLEKETV